MTTKWQVWDDEEDRWITISGTVVEMPDGSKALLTETFRKDGEDRAYVYAEGFRGGHHNGRWMQVAMDDLR